MFLLEVFCPRWFLVIAYVDESDEYANISQLLSRLWFNKPLLRQLFILQYELAQDKQKLIDTLNEEITKKLTKALAIMRKLKMELM